MLLLLISLLAGALTILAPCVLPVLPVIIGGSIGGTTRSRLRPYLVAASLGVSVIVFTLLLKVSTLLINVPPNTLNYLSGGLLIALGLVSTMPEAWEWLMIALNWQAASQRFLGQGERLSGEYTGPILVGVALGPVFSSCSPTYAFILASILPFSLSSGLIYLTAYALGLVVTLLAVSLVGRKLLSRFQWAADTHSGFRRAIGLLFVVIGVVIIAGKAIPVETWVANHLPFNESNIEQTLLQQQHGKLAPQAVSGNSSLLSYSPPQAAPALVGLTNWINSPPLKLSQLKGKVVLVDFWTYSCINCIRSIPNVEKWYQTYHSKGLDVIGVSTPEFAFEHNPANVQAAVKRFGITYPVALDNNYQTWNAFNNDSWPAEYLIDKNGFIRYADLEEGNYRTTDAAIQALLGLKQASATPVSTVPISQDQTPETYFGTDRSQNFMGQPQPSGGLQTFTPSSDLPTDYWTLGGKWQIGGQYITAAGSSASLTFNIYAKDVYVVAGNNGSAPQTVRVQLNNGANANYGPDDPSGNLVINGYRLYHIASLTGVGQATVKLTVPAGVQLYTFTFGS